MILKSIGIIHSPFREARGTPIQSSMAEGAEGWVLHSLLSGRRTALVAPGKKGQAFKIYVRPSANSDVAAELQSGVIANVKNCDGSWCMIDGEGFKGYIQQVALWGAYPNEKVQ